MFFELNLFIRNHLFFWHWVHSLQNRPSLHLTHVTFSPNGCEVLLSYSGEHVYLMDVNFGMFSSLSHNIYMSNSWYNVQPFKCCRERRCCYVYCQWLTKTKCFRAHSEWDSKCSNQNNHEQTEAFTGSFSTDIYSWPLSLL